MSIEPVWGAPIAWYLFLAGLGAGAYITSAFLRWRHPEACGMRLAGHVIAPIAVAIGLVLLMVDAEAGLHNPLRFALLLSNFGSVMTWGVVFLSVFMAVALITAALDLMKKKVPGWLEMAGAVVALCVAAYTGALLGVCKPIPCGTTRFCLCCSPCRPFPQLQRRSCWRPWYVMPTSSTRRVC